MSHLSNSCSEADVTNFWQANLTFIDLCSKECVYLIWFTVEYANTFTYKIASFLQITGVT